MNQNLNIKVRKEEILIYEEEHSFKVESNNERVSMHGEV